MERGHISIPYLALGLWIPALFYLLIFPFGPTFAQTCSDQWDVCSVAADQNSDRCWAECDTRFPDNFDSWDRCTDKCNDNWDLESNSCEQQYDRCEAGGGALRPDLSGSQQSGQDGCYFGECPDTIDTSQPPPSSPQQPVPQQTPQPMPQPLPQNQHFTRICQTTYFWCTMNVQGQVGMPCYCYDNFHVPHNGVTVPE